MKGVLLGDTRVTDIVEKLFCTTPISKPNFRDDFNYFQSSRTLEKSTSNNEYRRTGLWWGIKPRLESFVLVRASSPQWAPEVIIPPLRRSCITCRPHVTKYMFFSRRLTSDLEFRSDAAFDWGSGLNFGVLVAVLNVFEKSIDNPKLQKKTFRRTENEDSLLLKIDIVVKLKWGLSRKSWWMFSTVIVIRSSWRKRWY